MLVKKLTCFKGEVKAAVISVYVCIRKGKLIEMDINQNIGNVEN